MLSLQYIYLSVTPILLLFCFKDHRGKGKAFFCSWNSLMHACMVSEIIVLFCLYDQNFCILIYQVYNEKKFDSWCHVSINFFFTWMLIGIKIAANATYDVQSQTHWKLILLHVVNTIFSNACYNSDLYYFWLHHCCHRLYEALIPCI